MKFLHRIKQIRLGIYFLVFSLVFNPLLSYNYAQAAQLASPLLIVNNNISFAGIRANPSDPFDFELMLDTNGLKFEKSVLESKSNEFIQYFLTSLTLDDSSIWVNLSPDEPDRMLDDAFAKTLMGADMLAADEQLKRSAAALTDPSTSSGKAYWNLLNRHGVQASSDVLSRIWIVPGDINLVKDENAIVIEDAALELKNENYNSAVASVAVEAVSNHIVPALKLEINQSEDFAKLRQMFRAYIAAVWYKISLKNSIINKVYSGKTKVDGINSSDVAKCEQIYQSYLESFKEGVVNKYVKERELNSGRLVKRHYFSGGVSPAEDGTVARAVVDAKTSSSVGYAIPDYVKVNFQLHRLDEKESESYLRPYFYVEQPDLALVPNDIFDEFIEKFDKRYEKLVLDGPGDSDILYSKRYDYVDFLSKFVEHFKTMSEENREVFLYSKESSIYSFAERIKTINAYYFSRAINKNNGAGDAHLLESLDPLLEILYSQQRKAMVNLNFIDHLRQTPLYLEDMIQMLKAGDTNKELRLVVGHEGDDFDTQMTALQESQIANAAEGHLGKVTVPLLGTKNILKECTDFIDEETGKMIPRVHETIQRLIAEGVLDKVKWVLVDHNSEEQFLQHFARYNLDAETIEKLKSNIVYIKDHHSTNGLVVEKNIPAKIEKNNGSAAGFVLEDYLGMGVIPPKHIVESLSAVMLVDSENGQTMGHKMSVMHEAATRWWNVFGEVYYLEKHLKGTVFPRTAKETVNLENKTFGSGTTFHFSVDQIRPGLFDQYGNVKDGKLFDEIISEEKAKLSKLDEAFSVVKIFDHVENSVKVNAERIYVLFNTDKYDIDREFARKMLEALSREYLVAMGLSKNDLSIHMGHGNGYLTIINAGAHLQRKELDPAARKITKNNKDLIEKKVGGIRFGDSGVSEQLLDSHLDIDFEGMDVENFAGFAYQVEGIVLPKVYDSYKPVVVNF